MNSTARKTRLRLAQTNYCYLVESSPIDTYFDPPLLQRISGNPLFSMGNPLRFLFHKFAICVFG